MFRKTAQIMEQGKWNGLKQTDNVNNTITSMFTGNNVRLNMFILNMFWCIITIQQSMLTQEFEQNNFTEQCKNCWTNYWTINKNETKTNKTNIMKIRNTGI